MIINHNIYFMILFMFFSLNSHAEGTRSYITVGYTAPSFSIASTTNMYEYIESDEAFQDKNDFTDFFYYNDHYSLAFFAKVYNISTTFEENEGGYFPDNFTASTNSDDILLPQNSSFQKKSGFVGAGVSNGIFTIGLGIEHTISPKELYVFRDPDSYSAFDAPKYVVDAEAKITTIGAWLAFNSEIFYLDHAMRHPGDEVQGPFVSAKAFAGVDYYQHGDNVQSDYSYATELLADDNGNSGSGSELKVSNSVGVKVDAEIELGWVYAQATNTFSTNLAFGLAVNLSALQNISANVFDDPTSEYNLVKEIGYIDIAGLGFVRFTLMF